MSRVAAPADKRFRRAHVKPSRRRPWRRVLVPVGKYVVSAVLLVYAMYALGAVVTHATVLQIDRVAVSGNQWLSTREVQEVLAEMRGENILWTDLDGWRRRILSSPWVKDAALRRSLPSTVEVIVSERTPVCIGRLNGSLYLVDGHGVVIDEYGPQYAEFDLPIVDGLAGPGGSSASGADEQRAGLAARVVGAVAADPGVAGRLSQLDVSDVHNVTAILSGDPAVLYLGREKFLERLQSYLQLAPVLRERVPEMDYVDLRFDQRVYVKPTRGSR